MHQSKTRIPGFDFARALAVFGMVTVNFKIVMNAGKDADDGLASLAGLLEGRAAATFVVLAGIGLSLLSQGARNNNDSESLRKNRKTLLKRAVFLFIIGLIYSPIWPADILHFYGIYIIIGAFTLTVSDRWLWGLSGIFCLTFVLLLIIFNYETGWNWDTFHYSDFWTLKGMIRHLFYNGFHPVFPWTAFLFTGMWLGRRDITDPVWRKKLLAWCICVWILVETMSWLLVRMFAAQATGSQAEEIKYLFGTGPMPPVPFYLVSAGSTAIIVIILSVILTERFSNSSWIYPFISTGRLALTLYVAHVVIGMGLLDILGCLENQSMVFAMTYASGFCIASVLFSCLWSLRFKAGPLEGVLRKVA